MMMTVATLCSSVTICIGCVYAFPSRSVAICINQARVYMTKCDCVCVLPCQVRCGLEESGWQVVLVHGHLQHRPSFQVD